MKDDSKVRVTAYRLHLKTIYTNIKLRDMLRKQERASEREKMSELSELERERMIELRKKERLQKGYHSYY